MHTLESEELDRVFAALANPVRRALLDQCSDQRQSINELAEPHSLSLNAISKHVKVLESARLVSRTVDGNLHCIGVQPETAMAAVEWLRYHVNLWDQSLSALKCKLEDE